MAQGRRIRPKVGCHVHAGVDMFPLTGQACLRKHGHVFSLIAIALGATPKRGLSVLAWKQPCPCEDTLKNKFWGVAPSTGSTTLNTYKRRHGTRLLVMWVVVSLAISLASAAESSSGPILTLNAQDTGYRGIWYMNEPLKNAYRFKYSGGMATFCAKHQPFAVYCDQVKKTFFCYGGTAEDSYRKYDLMTTSDSKGAPGALLHMVSYYDHATGKVPRPTILLDKQTKDAHDNPVIAVDDQGHIWIFSTSHGTSRPSYIHRSTEPYSIDKFEQVPATKMEDDREVPMTNFSYMQSWHVPARGFVAFFTRYNYPAARTACFMTSPDGVHWSQWQRLAAIDQGHYQISTVDEQKAASALDYHPQGKGLNGRTNLYYMETTDFGRSWHNAKGENLTLPLTTPQNAALVRDYQKEGLLVYVKDIRFDTSHRPVILFVLSKGFQSGPENGPRAWATARWTGSTWEIRPITTSGNNYDTGSLYLEEEGTWRVIAPTEPGPQPYNPGGEMAVWTSSDQGVTWSKVSRLTSGSSLNHNYARRPVSAQDGFYAFWADGHGRQPSPSSLYFCTKAGDVYRLPHRMTDEFARPERVN